MKKHFPFFYLFSLLLLSCDSTVFLSRDKKFPPDENKIWYSQNEQDSYPNIEIATVEGMTTTASYAGYILYKKEKIKVEIFSLVSTRNFGFAYYKEKGLTSDYCWITYVYNYKENYIELRKKDIENPDKFGFNFNNFLPFNLYIKDFNKDEWLAKYPEDKEAKENPNEEKQSNL